MFCKSKKQKVNKNQLSLFSLDFFPDTIQNLTQLLLKVRNIKYEIEKKRNIEYLNSLDDEEFLNEMNSECIFKSEKGKGTKDWKRTVRELIGVKITTNTDKSIVPYLDEKKFSTLLSLIKDDYDSLASMTLYYNWEFYAKSGMEWIEWEKHMGIDPNKTKFSSYSKYEIEIPKKEKCNCGV